MVYSRFCSVSFTLRHSLKTVFPRVPCLSVAVYVVKKIVTPKEPLHKHNKVLCNTLNFHPCISPFIPIDFRLLFRYCVTCKWNYVGSAPYQILRSKTKNKSPCSPIPPSTFPLKDDMLCCQKGGNEHETQRKDNQTNLQRLFLIVRDSRCCFP